MGINWEKPPEARAIDEGMRKKNKGLGFLRDDNDYAVSWIKSYGRGRVFYTRINHEHGTIADPRYLKHLLAAIQYVCGDLPPPTKEK